VVEEARSVPASGRVEGHGDARSRGLAGKRAFDLCVSAALLLLLLPLLLLIAVLVRLDSPGPVLHRQRRVGLGGGTFTMLKFRSMDEDSPESPHRQALQTWFAGAPVPDGYKPACDPRVTRAGRMLRRLSLDELPQLLNVLRGDMSLVGPRPALPYEIPLYEPWYFERLQAKPGMTGLWQVSGRHHRSGPEMMELDVRYVRERSLRLDLGILFRTLPAMLGRQPGR
jgi:lipopolysaccharide/colanic/teichoic acid biosynthesis glycosyltransferase